MAKLSQAPKRRSINLVIRKKDISFFGFIRNFNPADKKALPIYEQKGRTPQEVSNISTRYVFQTIKGDVIRLSSSGEYDKVYYEPNSQRLYMNGKCSGIGKLERLTTK